MGMQLRLKRNVIHVIFSRLTAEPALLNQLWASLSSDEHARAFRYQRAKDRNSFTVTRALLRALLGKCLRAAAPGLSFSYTSHGKPSVNNERGVRFNVAHSEDFMVCALGLDDELGVDIEYIQPMVDLECVAEQCFCVAEYRQLLAVGAEKRAKAFFDCWTRKEAFVKALGEGLSYPLNRFQVTLRPGEQPTFVRIAGCDASTLEWALHDVTPAADYAAALAVKNRNCELRIWKFLTAMDCNLFCGQNS
jgi:4'-phosphopantetheinyl transferase